MRSSPRTGRILRRAGRPLSQLFVVESRLILELRQFAPDGHERSACAGVLLQQCAKMLIVDEKTVIVDEDGFLERVPRSTGHDGEGEGEEEEEEEAG